MMGRTPPRPGKLFYAGFTLDNRVRRDHPLRTIRQLVDFDFVYQEVQECYGYNGNVSVPPPVIVKLMFLLFYYDVASERELLATLPERLDWLWFLGYDLDDPLPDHSVLSKARQRWGSDVFWRLFVRTVEQCLGLGLVDGQRVYCDSSLVDANAANDSIRSTKRFPVLYGIMAQRLADGDRLVETPSEPERPYVSTTDPDAAVVPGRGGARARYKTHRLVDDRRGVITATQITHGAINEAHRLGSLLDQHEVTTGQKVRAVAADSKYGTIENYLACHDRNVVAHMPDLKQATATSGQKRGKYPDTAFQYCPEEDVYLCPAGQRLKRRNFDAARQAYEYCGSKRVCGGCRLREQCTTAKNGRSIKRHVRQEELEELWREARSWRARVDLKRRKTIMEGSFADGANNHGLKRARWRGQERMEIQDYLIAAVQNIRIMAKVWLKRAGTGGHGLLPPIQTALPARVIAAASGWWRAILDGMGTRFIRIWLRISLDQLSTAQN